ncbi:DinB family protein [Novipirellula sp.]|uniref:DinB family protein n=1 Tax=Novipirellula sp. TaxID=2795430 RepID=UPI00356A08A9
MDLVDCLLRHDAWTTKRILDICAELSVADLDRDFDIGHRTLRRTLDHIIHNMEIWSALMAQREYERSTDQTIPGMAQRLANAESRLRKVAQDVAESNAWNQTWYDHLDRPPRKKRFGTTIAHLITHSMHHRAQLLYMLRLCGVRDLPEGDVFSWEAETEGTPKP